MTDRVQPGAIDSVIRNDELSQIYNQFSEGWIVDTGTTAAARRRPEIDETALNSFATAGQGFLSITIDPGEAFVGGWCARDVKTTVSLPANDTATIVVGWDLDVAFNASTDPTRDSADETLVQLQRNTDSDYPVTPIFDVTTDSSSVVSTTDRRNLGPTSVVDILEAATVETNNLDATAATVDDLNTATSLTDPAGVSHSGEIADIGDAVTRFGTGTVADGEFVQNVGGALVGAERVKNATAKLTLTLTQSVSQNTTTTIAFDNVSFNQNTAIYDTTTSTASLIEINDPGIYQVVSNYKLGSQNDVRFETSRRNPGVSSTTITSDISDSSRSGSTTAVIEITSPPIEISSIITLTAGSGDLQTSETVLTVTKQT